MRYLLLGILVVLGGCGSMPRGEWGYQGVHGLDALQTYNTTVRDPNCFRESGALIKEIIGEDPSESDVIGWWLMAGSLHYGVSLILEDSAPEWVSVAWQGLTIGGTTLTVMQNYQTGARPWGDNDYSYGSDCYG